MLLTSYFSHAHPPKVDWQEIGSLQAPEQYSESIGISAAYTGFIGQYLVLAGGANFPNGHPFFKTA
tara:strand:- start:8623 stop:8820 length:198 start_codon:yes stop_codon:yes gene_type:complete